MYFAKILYLVATVSADIKAKVQALESNAHVDKITKWLAAPDPSTNLNKARELHQRGTGHWLLDSDTYRSWKKDNASFLWLYGIPGCGKTILSSTVIADLDKDARTSSSLLYFYFNFTDVEKRSTEKAVRSLITQLYHKRANTRGLLDSLYVKSEGQPTLISLQQTLQAMITLCRDVWIIMDGLDECDTRGQHAIDSVLLWIKMLRQSLSNAHILITSRPENDIKLSIETWASTKEMILLQSTLVADDISAYICERVDKIKRWQARPDVQNLIANTLNEKAHGM